MRITYTDFVLRLLTRHGALPLFLVLLGLAVLVLRSSLRGSVHADAAGFVSLGVLAASISGALAIAPAASRTGKAWATGGPCPRQARTRVLTLVRQAAAPPACWAAHPCAMAAIHIPRGDDPG